MMGIGLPELVIILIVGFLIFGAKRLPDLGSGIGKAIRSFNRSIRGEKDEDEEAKKSNSSKDKIES